MHNFFSIKYTNFYAVFNSANEFRDDMKTYPELRFLSLSSIFSPLCTGRAGYKPALPVISSCTARSVLYSMTLDI